MSRAFFLILVSRAYFMISRAFIGIYWYQEHILLLWWYQEFLHIKNMFILIFGIKNMFTSLVSNIMFMHIYVKHSLHIYYVYCYAWVKGELLWSLTLIHAYITLWVLSSSKRGRLLAQRPFTLVLMMINSCSYCLLTILWYLVSDIWSRY